MITNINLNFPHLNIEKSTSSLHITDYTKKTSGARNVEITSSSPQNIQSLFVENENSLPISYIIFDNSSFTFHHRRSKRLQPRSQCECMLFPTETNHTSWTLFCELKYCQEKNNANNIEKAIKQLYKTRYYFVQKSIIDNERKCYFVISLPEQDSPFQNSILNLDIINTLLTERHIHIKDTNRIAIINNTSINL